MLLIIGTGIVKSSKKKKTKKNVKRERERERERKRKRELLNLLKESDDEYGSRLDGADVRFKRHHNYHSEV